MPPDFLDRILDRKRQEVEEARKRVPERELREKASMPREKRSFMGSLSKPGIHGANIIAEIKRASPSRGPINADLDTASYAGSYERGGAAALSVLTDREFFQARPEDLPQARAAVSLPVLRKDFVITPYQVLETAAWGADAVLLIVRALSRETLKDLLDLSREVRLDSLVEVHSEEEMEVATVAGARLIGINNRDLSTFKTDIETSVKLARNLDSTQVAVAESGIHGRAEIEKLLEAGVWNFLIGESLVRSANPENFLRELLGVTS